MTRDDLNRFRKRNVDFESIGLDDSGGLTPYFCTPVNAEYVGGLGCDGVHFILLPGDERVYCVDPSMGEPGTYVLPVAPDFRAFLSYLLYCRDANPLAQIAWLDESGFRALLAEEAARTWEDGGTFLARKQAALSAVAEAFGLSPADPFALVKALQAGFNPSHLTFSDEYYDVLGLDRPGGEG